MINKNLAMGVFLLVIGGAYLVYLLMKKSDESKKDMVFANQVKVYAGVTILILIGILLLLRELDI